MFFYTRAPASLVSWTISQQAFNSSMILLLDALETGNLSHVRKVEQAYVVFRELQDNGVHKLAGLVVEKLSWGLDQLRKNMGGIDTHQSPDHIEPASAAQDEADGVTRVFHDTVMGNTGMFLPEEPGLQSYTPERFAPFTWAVTGSESGAMTSNQLKQEQELQPYGNVSSLAHMRLESSSKIVSILKEMQGSAGSHQRSASGQHCAPPSQELSKPRSCVTGLASPMSLVEPVLRQDHRDKAIVTEHRHSQQKQSPHSQHPNSRRITPPTAFTSDLRLEFATERSGGIQPPEPWAQPASTPKQYQMSAAQLRHNSCPALHQLATTPPLLRPTHSSPLANRAQSPVSNERHDVHTQWSANPAAPMLGSPEPGMVISPMSDQGHSIPAFRHESAQQQQMAYQYSFSNPTTTTRVDQIAETNMEQMTVDQWKRWVGSGAPG